MRSSFFCSVALSVLVVSACSITDASHAKKLNISPELQGIWLSEGYGYAVELGRKKVSVYDVTDTICINSPEKSQQIAHYLITNPPKIAPDVNSFAFSTTLEEYAIQMNRVEQLPAQCTKLTRDTPQGNFDAFVSFFDTHYAFFDLYGVDWNAAVAAKQSLVNAKTSDEQLFQIVSDLMKPMTDGHLSLEAKIAGKERQFEPGQGKTADRISELANAAGVERGKFANGFMKKHWMKGVGQGVLKGEGEMAGGYFIQYGLASKDVGYIGFLTEAGYAGGELMREEQDLKVLDEAMEKALGNFEKVDVKAVIVDISANFGGYDFIARDIAGRFAKERAFAYDKFAAELPNSTPVKHYVEPSIGKRFTGPVYLLTSDVTVSAGEMLTMAMRVLPNVIHAGAPTRGALSDVLQKTLPNGWKLGLSNEIYSDADGVRWEGIGIKPEMPLVVFDPNDLENSHRKAIKTLLTEINAKY